MRDPYTTPKISDFAEVFDQFQRLFGEAEQAASNPEALLCSTIGLQKKLQGTIADMHLVGVFSLLSRAFGELCWEHSGCHEAEFKLLWSLRSAIVYGNGDIRKLRGNHQRKSITEGFKQLKAGVFGVAPYFVLVEGDRLRLDGANLRLTTLVHDLLRAMDSN